MSIRKNYWLQDLKTRQIACKGAVSGILVIVTAWLFYRAVWGILILLPMGGLYFQSLLADVEKKEKEKYLMQFKTFIQGISASMNTGYSVENAILESRKEMTLLYKKEERIMRETDVLIRQIRLQRPVETAMYEMAERSGLEDVKSFAAVFQIAKRSGGNIVAVIRSSVAQISGKIDIKREIDTILAARRYEFKIMTMIPYGIVMYMAFGFPEFMQRLYGNIAGIGVMTICLILYVGAYLLGLKITSIEM